ncbi:MAG: hypothetical protein KBT19_01650 [Lachnospiraceae bacterium]|nr:hypothetical protein [Candidatus Colinaster equi]
MFTEGMTAEQILLKYSDDINRLAAYIPYLETKSGKTVVNMYDGDDVGAKTCTFPVYDSNLMNFIKEMDHSNLMDRNYRYVYSRNRIQGPSDELRVIEQATILQMDQIAGILSHYVMGGRTKARLWSDGVTNGVFLAALSKAKELVDFWTNATTMEGRQ